jgi:hypothetical protein
MEIHPPHGPVESIKDFVLHLSMITIGILIALGLEQAVEAWHHHELAVEARENILSEIRDNKRELEASRKTQQQNIEKLGQALVTIHRLLAREKQVHAQITVAVNGADLNSTSWTTASTTGALSYMGYDQAKKFAKAYDVQTLLQHMQNDAFRAASQALALLAYGAVRPEDLTADQLKTVEQEALQCMALLGSWEQIAAQLDNEYARVLK